ncbi:MAG: MqnA/MqnD/SBP family protein [Eubacteriales bacterium]
MKKLIHVAVVLLIISTMTACVNTSETEEVVTQETATQEVAEEVEEVVEVVEEESVQEDPADVRVVGLKGTTTMGLVGFMDWVDAGVEYDNNYTFSMITAIDEVTAMLAKGEVDIAAVPANLASVLYANTDGGVQVIALNTLGVLYVVENGESVTDIESLRGKTIVASGKGSTPEMALRYVLLENGIDPDTDVTIEWKTEQSECLAYVTANEGAIAMMPEPFVTTALLANEAVNVRLDLTEEWDATQVDSDNPSSLITGVMVVRTEFAEEHPEALGEFMEHYVESVTFVNSDVEAAASLVEYYEITTYETAVAAIPNCNIVCIAGEEMKTALEGYLTVLFEQNETSVGGSMPADEFYYIP